MVYSNKLSKKEMRFNSNWQTSILLLHLSVIQLLEFSTFYDWRIKLYLTDVENYEIQTRWF